MTQWMFLAIATSLILAIWVWVPVALVIAQPAARDGSSQAPFSWLRKSYFICAALGALSFLLPPGQLAAASAAAWLAFTLAIGVLGSLRLAYYGFVRADETIISFGMIFLSVGGIWLVASRLGYPLFGFKEPLVALTAVHFHYTGLVTTVAVGLIGRLLPSNEPLIRAIYRFVCVSMVAAIPLVAIGINGHPRIERAGVVWLVISLVLFAGLLIKVASNRLLSKIPRFLIVFASITIVISMSLTLIYRFRIFAITIPQMLMTHGILNAFVFVPLLMIAICMLHPAAKIADFSRPLSRLRSKGAVGPAFFRNIGAIEAGVAVPHGLIDNLNDFARADLNVARIDPRIRAFYEETLEHDLAVAAKWGTLFDSGWRTVVERFFASCGQLTLPSEDMRITSSIEPIKSPLDSRRAIRSWVRVNSATGNAIYVAAYSQHRNRGETYMNIAFPLPSCNLTSILRFDQLASTNFYSDVVLSTLPREEFAGDEGIYLVLPFTYLRLPMDETISVFGGDTLQAKHEIWLFGVSLLTLNYTITRRACE